jgi:hypothetical protein
MKAAPVRRIEDQLQKDVVRAARDLGFLTVRIKNEGRRTPRQIAYEKAMGLTAGSPDLAVISKRGKTFWMELKKQKGVLSYEQQEFRNRADDCVVVRSLDEAVAYLQEWKGEQ